VAARSFDVYLLKKAFLIIYCDTILFFQCMSILKYLLREHELLLLKFDI